MSIPQQNISDSLDSFHMSNKCRFQYLFTQCVSVAAYSVFVVDNLTAEKDTLCQSCHSHESYDQYLKSTMVQMPDMQYWAFDFS